jgi:hypothetical protein
MENPSMQPENIRTTKTNQPWRPPRRRGIFLPLMMILIGVILLLNSLGNLPGNAWSLLLRLWPLLLVAGGLDGLLRGEGPIGEILWGGLGVLFLLSNLGYLPFSVLELIWRLWPVILVGWGLQLIIGHRNLLTYWISFAAGLVLMVGVVFLAYQPAIFPVNVRTEQISEDLGNLKAAKIEISTAVGKQIVSGVAEPGKLLEGEFGLMSSESYQRNFSTEAGVGNYKLENTGGPGMILFGNSSTTIGVDIKLNPDLPLKLSFNLAVGDQKLDLSKYNIKELAVNLAVGSMTVTLPADGNFSGQLHTALGEITIIVPKGAYVRINAHTGVGNVSAPDNYQRNGDQLTSGAMGAAGQIIDLKVDVAVGTITVINP